MINMIPFSPINFLGKEFKLRILELEYITDGNRHLICIPYTISNLHRMADRLGINRGWYHTGNGLDHYDIPLSRKKEIEEKCRFVSSRELIKIIKNAQSEKTGLPSRLFIRCDEDKSK